MDTAAKDRPLGGSLQLAMTVVARDALASGIGGTLPTNQHYLDTYGIAAGTAQRTVAKLQEAGAVMVKSRGQLGRVITAIDIAAIWRAARLNPVNLALPPAGPVEITALEQVLAEAFSSLGIPHTARHLRGGSVRLRMVTNGDVDVAVASAGTLQATVGDFRRRVLGAGTYYGPGRIAVVTRNADAGTPPRRIAVDMNSPDHRAISFGEFPRGNGYEYVNVPFPHVPAAVLAREADSGIWHITPSVVPLDLAGIHLGSLSTPQGVKAWEIASEAVLVTGAQRPELGTVLDRLNLDRLRALQATAIEADTGLVAI